MSILEKTSNFKYWEDKFAAYMHDPFDKAIEILGHEERAARYLDKFGVQKPNEEFWKIADAIAAGFERGQFPKYSKDTTKSGAIDFVKNGAIITHPISYSKIGFKINSIDIEKFSNETLNFITKEVGTKPGEGGYSDNFSFNNDLFPFSKTRLIYVHFKLRHKLSEKNIGGLGALWHRIHADTRIPDHSIWQHNALTSALYSTIVLGNGDMNNIGLMVISITPVQQFIAKARKLRDYWTGSVLLSWLAFEGIKWVVENIGFDHIVYPSLVDQPLMAEYLKKEWHIEDISYNNRRDIASFPNKFMLIAPLNYVDEIGNSIEKSIMTGWGNFVDEGYKYLSDELSDLNKDEKKYIKELFDRQTSNFWDIRWSAIKMLSFNDKKSVLELIDEEYWNNKEHLYQMFQKMYSSNYSSSSLGIFYSVSHALLQSSLAAEKTKRTVKRKEEPGEKCHLCGEFEVVHLKGYDGSISANEYKKNIDEFWEKISSKFGLAEIKENEKLCSVCLLKRLAHRILKNSNSYISPTFKKVDNFPTVTEVALYHFYKRENIKDKDKRKIADALYNTDEDNLEDKSKINGEIIKYINKIKDFDKYYTILMMDGDKMGQLINGKTIEAEWKTVLHPALVNKIEAKVFDKKYNDNWSNIFNSEKYKKRSITPSIHAAISEALGDFSIYGVPNIVEKYNGKLIYAGGDDVCAILPVGTALKAAREIQEYYNSYFKLIVEGDHQEDINGLENIPEKGKLSINIGLGKELSISAAILVCHHKEDLSKMIERAHNLLEDVAKEKSGRNSCAIELKKRGGGSRYFFRKWDSTAWNAFDMLIKSIKTKKDSEISTSFVYKIEYFRDGINAILEQEIDDKKKKEQLSKFFESQLEQSNYSKEKKEEMSKYITDIVVRENEHGSYIFDSQGLIIAAFLGNFNISVNKGETND